MITAEMLQSCSSLTKDDLVQILDTSGYSMCAFETAKFLGLTDSGQYCYEVTFFDEFERDWGVGKIFVSTTSDGALSAEY